MILFFRHYDNFLRKVEVPARATVKVLRAFVLNQFRDLNDDIELVFNGRILEDGNTLLQNLGISDRHVLAIWDRKTGKNPDKILKALKEYTPERVPIWNGTFSSKIGIQDVQNMSYFFQQRQDEYAEFIQNPFFRQAVTTMDSDNFIAWTRANPDVFVEMKQYFAKYFEDQTKKKSAEMEDRMFQDNVYPEAFLESAGVQLYNDEDFEIQMAIQASIEMMNYRPDGHSEPKEEIPDADENVGGDKPSVLEDKRRRAGPLAPNDLEEYEPHFQIPAAVTAEKKAEEKVDWDELFEGLVSLSVARSDSQEPEKPPEVPETRFSDSGSYFAHMRRTRGPGLRGLQEIEIRDPMVPQEKLDEMGKLPHSDF